MWKKEISGTNLTSGYFNRPGGVVIDDANNITVYGEIDNLKRGGSDYTASLIGVAVDAEEIQIWTDVNGFHFNDPDSADIVMSTFSKSFASSL